VEKAVTDQLCGGAPERNKACRTESGPKKTISPYSACTALSQGLPPSDTTPDSGPSRPAILRARLNRHRSAARRRARRRARNRISPKESAPRWATMPSVTVGRVSASSSRLNCCRARPGAGCHWRAGSLRIRSVCFVSQHNRACRRSRAATAAGSSMCSRVTFAVYIAALAVAEV
jgi:hypothetical protein